MSMLSRGHTYMQAYALSFWTAQSAQFSWCGAYRAFCHFFFSLTSHKLLVPLTRVTDCKELYKVKCKAEQTYEDCKLI